MNFITRMIRKGDISAHKVKDWSYWIVTFKCWIIAFVQCAWSEISNLTTPWHLLTSWPVEYNLWSSWIVALVITEYQHFKKVVSIFTQRVYFKNWTRLFWHIVHTYLGSVSGAEDAETHGYPAHHQAGVVHKQSKQKPMLIFSTNFPLKKPHKKIFFSGLAFTPPHPLPS